MSCDQVEEVPDIWRDAAQASKQDNPKCAISEYKPINHITWTAPLIALLFLIKVYDPRVNILLTDGA